MSVPGKLLSPGNIAKKVFDENADAIRVTGSVGGVSEVIIDAASGDNIAIKNSDGSDITSSNPLPVIFSGVVDPYKNITLYNEITNVASSVDSLIVTYTVPAGKSAKLMLAEASGTNIAEYTLYVNGNAIAKKRTMFGSNLNCDFSFSAGCDLLAGDVVTAKVVHLRPSLGSFNITLNLKEEI